ADRRRRDPHDRVGGLLDPRIGHIAHGHFSAALPGHRPHGRSRAGAAVIAVRVIAHLLSRACATIAAGTQGLDTAARARLMPKTDAAPRAPATTHAREAAGTRHPSACQAPR